ncbi:MAG: hypothetical protein IPL61_12240 [Myxococcales bacterium]|nr:hypothetical protein [Myxococcales bacterium]
MSPATRTSTLVLFIALAAVALITGAVGDALAQAVRLPPGVGVGPPTRAPSGWSVVWDVLSQPKIFIPLVGLTLGFVGGLLAGDDESWLKLFALFAIALVAAIILFESGLRVLAQPGKATAGVATLVVAVFAVLMLVLKHTRPVFFASTEVAFSLAVIYFSIRSLDGGGEKWATLVLGVYGVVDGLDRAWAEIRTWDQPGATAAAPADDDADDDDAAEERAAEDDANAAADADEPAAAAPKA